MKRVAQALLVLGVAHVAYGLISFREPLADAVTAGVVGQFASPEERRSAFWFLMSGPLLMALGHVAVRAVARSDMGTLRVVGRYLAVGSLVGVVAFPASPLWISLILGGLLALRR